MSDITAWQVQYNCIADTISNRAGIAVISLIWSDGQIAGNHVFYSQFLRSCFEFVAQSTHENGYIKPRKTFWRNSKQLLSKCDTIICNIDNGYVRKSVYFWAIETDNTMSL